MTYAVKFLLFLYILTWRWSSKRAETCRRPNNKVNIHKQLCFDSLKSFSLLTSEIIVGHEGTCHKANARTIDW